MFTLMLVEASNTAPLTADVALNCKTVSTTSAVSKVVNGARRAQLKAKTHDVEPTLLLLLRQPARIEA